MSIAAYVSEETKNTNTLPSFMEEPVRKSSEQRKLETPNPFSALSNYVTIIDDMIPVNAEDEPATPKDYLEYKGRDNNVWRKVAKRILKDEQKLPSPTTPMIQRQIWVRKMKDVAAIACEELLGEIEKTIKVDTQRKFIRPGVSFREVVAPPKINTVTTAIPAATRSKHDIDRIKSKRKHGEIKQARSQVYRPINLPATPAKVAGDHKTDVVVKTPKQQVVVKESVDVSKSADEDETKSDEKDKEVVPYVESRNDLSELDRTPKRVVLWKVPGNTHVALYARRTLRVKFDTYSIPDVYTLGFECESLTQDYTRRVLGWKCEGDYSTVMLPTSVVESLGTAMVGKIRDHASFLVLQATCKHLLTHIDFTDPQQEVDAALYCPLVAWYRYDRAISDVHSRVLGRVTTQSSRSAMIAAGMLTAGLSLIPGCAAASLATTVSTSALVVSAPILLTLPISCYLVYKAVSFIHACTGFFQSKQPILHTVVDSVVSEALPVKLAEGAKIELIDTKRDPEQIGPAAMCTGIGIKRFRPTIFAKNQVNTVKALEKRSCGEPHPIKGKTREHFCKWVLDNWELLVGRFHDLRVPTDPKEWFQEVLEWIKLCGSSPAMKIRYMECAQEFYNNGWTSYTNFTDEQVDEWCRRECSVKFEGVLKDENKSPRQILACTPQYVICCAPFIRKFTGVINRAWSPFKEHNNSKFRPIYAPGRSSKTIADAFMERDYKHKVHGDRESYDLNQGEELAKLEIEICRRYRAPPLMLRLMYRSLNTKGFSRAGVKFRGKCTRKSGNPETTVFNTAINVLDAAHSYALARDVCVPDIDMIIVAGGDDSIMGYDGELIPFDQLSANAGLPLQSYHVNTPVEIEFLSCRLMETSTGWNFVPMPGKMIAKLGYSIKARNEDEAKAIARGAMLSIQASSRCCPPLRAYVDRILELAGDGPVIKPTDEFWKLTVMDTGETTVDTWVALEHVYQWNSALQSCWEKELQDIKLCGVELESSVIEILCDVDTNFSHCVLPKPLDSIETRDDDEYDFNYINNMFNLPTIPETGYVNLDVADFYQGYEDYSNPYYEQGNGWIRDLSREDGEAKQPGPSERKRTGRRRRPNVEARRRPTEPRRGRKRAAVGRTRGRRKRPARPVQPGINVSGTGDYTLASGSSLGSRAGAWLGDKAGSMISSLIGCGDYSVSKNSITQTPVEFEAAKKGYRVAHTDYITDIVSPGTAFQVTSFVINPMNPSLFPWLPNIAQNFEEFEVLGMVFMYKPTSGEAVSSTDAALGTVVFATQYNVNDAAFVDKLSMEQYQFATSTVPSSSMVHPVECDRSKTPISILYVAGPDSTTVDPKFSSLGVFNYATVGQQATANLGELWVSYDILFSKPRLLNGLPSNATLWWAYWNYLTNQVPLGNPGSMNYATYPSSTYAPALTFNANGPSGYPNQWIFTFPASVAGNFMLIIAAQKSSVWSTATLFNPSQFVYANGCTALQYMSAGGGNYYGVVGTGQLNTSYSSLNYVICFSIAPSVGSNLPSLTLVNNHIDSCIGLNMIILPILGTNAQAASMTGQAMQMFGNSRTAMATELMSLRKMVTDMSTTLSQLSINTSDKSDEKSQQRQDINVSSPSIPTTPDRNHVIQVEDEYVSVPSGWFAKGSVLLKKS